MKSGYYVVTSPCLVKIEILRIQTPPPHRKSSILLFFACFSQALYKILTLSWCHRKARHMPIPHSRNPWYERSPDEVHERQRCAILIGGRLYRCIPLRGIVRVSCISISVTYAIACEQAELSCLGWWRKRVSRQSHARDTKRPQLSWVEVLDESSLVQNSSFPFPANPSSGKAESNKYGALEYEAYNTEHCCNKTEGEAL